MNRCLCGLAIRHHFRAGRKIDCWEAAARHQRAAIKRTSFSTLLRKVVKR